MPRSNGVDWSVENIGKYDDLQLIIDAVNMAAGATIFSPWFDNVEWVRNALVMVQSDQQYDIGFVCRDVSGTGDIGLTAAATQATVASPSWRRHSLIGTSGLYGYSVRFFIKNSAAVPNAYGRVRVQLMGM